ncbi:VWA domain-containing protein [Actinomadura sp. LD22]|uniref:VWA domain-containing protein n=1 Tax=Actinomadura physcomitrii TaxID=2650748 RepID=A0A6I4M9K4_9ACTN|nr:VWA domain-containing protein [Actinomadura physcomitrii]MWA02363.1 VWA domain-containing protein [Actinomadura physcomitrii]MWA03065.1 VWA domain-containing protein [Actinomadura physcomitrii]
MFGGRRRAFLLPLAGATVLALVLVVSVYRVASAFGLGCAGGSPSLTLNVAADPAIAPIVARAARRATSGHAKAAGSCLRIRVRTAQSADIAELLAGQAVPRLGTVRPDVWIPDTDLWTALIPAAQRSALIPSGTRIASTPLVAALPRRLAGRTAGQEFLAVPSWKTMLKGAATQTAPPGSPASSPVQVQIPDPTRTGAGITALTVAATLTGNDPAQRAQFSGIARALREHQAPTVNDALTGNHRDPTFILAPEQAVYVHNRDVPTDPQVAVQPVEGTLTMDYPVLRVTRPGRRPLAPQQLDALHNRHLDQRRAAAGLLERALASQQTRRDILSSGFRTPDGQAPASFDALIGISPQSPQLLPAPPPDQVAQILQAWAQLSLGIRLLAVVDISGSMNQHIASRTSRLEATTAAMQQSLALFSDDSEVGLWEFSTDLDGHRPWKQLIDVGPLSQRFGSVTRRQLGLTAFSALKVKTHGDTGLYATVLAAYKEMQRSYKPEFVNTVALWTDGRNDDPAGPTLQHTLDALRRQADPTRPVQVMMFGIGAGTDTTALARIAQVVQGQTFQINSPQQMQTIFAQAISRRVCAPHCP